MRKEQRGAPVLVTTAPVDSRVEIDGREDHTGEATPRTYCEERTCYIISRQCQVRCRLWYEVAPFMHGLFKYFLVGIQQLE